MRNMQWRILCFYFFASTLTALVAKINNGRMGKCLEQHSCSEEHCCSERNIGSEEHSCLTKHYCANDNSEEKEDQKILVPNVQVTDDIVVKKLLKKGKGAKGVSVSTSSAETTTNKQVIEKSGSAESVLKKSKKSGTAETNISEQEEHVTLKNQSDKKLNKEKKGTKGDSLSESSETGESKLFVDIDINLDMDAEKLQQNQMFIETECTKNKEAEKKMESNGWENISGSDQSETFKIDLCEQQAKNIDEKKISEPQVKVTLKSKNAEKLNEEQKGMKVDNVLTSSETGESELYLDIDINLDADAGKLHQNQMLVESEYTKNKGAEKEMSYEWEKNSRSDKSEFFNIDLSEQEVKNIDEMKNSEEEKHVILKSRSSDKTSNKDKKGMKVDSLWKSPMSKNLKKSETAKTKISEQEEHVTLKSQSDKNSNIKQKGVNVDSLLTSSTLKNSIKSKKSGPAKMTISEQEEHVTLKSRNDEKSNKEKKEIKVDSLLKSHMPKRLKKSGTGETKISEQEEHVTLKNQSEKKLNKEKKGMKGVDLVKSSTLKNLIKSKKSETAKRNNSEQEEHVTLKSRSDKKSNIRLEQKGVKVDNLLKSMSKNLKKSGTSETNNSEQEEHVMLKSRSGKKSNKEKKGIIVDSLLKSPMLKNSIKSKKSGTAKTNISKQEEHVMLKSKSDEKSNIKPKGVNVDSVLKSPMSKNLKQSGIAETKIYKQEEYVTLKRGTNKNSNIDNSEEKEDQKILVAKINNERSGECLEQHSCSEEHCCREGNTGSEEHSCLPKHYCGNDKSEEKEDQKILVAKINNERSGECLGQLSCSEEHCCREGNTGSEEHSCLTKHYCANDNSEEKEDQKILVRNVQVTDDIVVKKLLKKGKGAKGVSDSASSAETTTNKQVIEKSGSAESALKKSKKSGAAKTNISEQEEHVTLKSRNNKKSNKDKKEKKRTKGDNLSESSETGESKLFLDIDINLDVDAEKLQQNQILVESKSSKNKGTEKKMEKSNGWEKISGSDQSGSFKIDLSEQQEKNINEKKISKQERHVTLKSRNDEESNEEQKGMKVDSVLKSSESGENKLYLDIDINLDADAEGKFFREGF